MLVYQRVCGARMFEYLEYVANILQHLQFLRNTWGKTITIPQPSPFLGGMFTIPSHGWFISVFPTLHGIVLNVLVCFNFWGIHGNSPNRHLGKPCKVYY